MKYEKPKLIAIDLIAKAKGSGISSPDCADGYSVTDVCPIANDPVAIFSRNGHAKSS